MARVKTVTLVADAAQTVHIPNDGKGAADDIICVKALGTGVVYVSTDATAAATVKGDNCIAISAPGFEYVATARVSATASGVSVISSGTPDVSIQDV